MGTIFQEHYERGLAEGEQRGVALGALRARREILIEQLEARFGPIPHPISERIASASTDELTAWQSRVLVASALEEIFAPRS